jgi:hydroxymethylbilane synthase
VTANRVFRLATRGSRLALWQAHAVSERLAAAGVRTTIVVITTTGDRVQAAPLEDRGHKRLFVKELEDALLHDEADIAVHSAKDMPVDLPDGLAIAACLPREDPRDGIVLPQQGAQRELTDVIRQLGEGAAIGTSSVRRIAQLAAFLPRATFAPIRGNVDTRLAKLDAGNFDALVLACAGLVRLGFGHRVSAGIPIEQCVPAPGQGIVATETRADDEAARRALDPIHDDRAGVALKAERAVVSGVGGGCQLPLGALTVHVDDALEMHGVVASLDGARVIRRAARGPANDPGGLGRRLADELVAAGAQEILSALR